MTKKITDPPKNVKEAIDWLICIGGNAVQGGRANNTNASAIKDAVNALTGSTSNTFQREIQTLIQKLSDFLGRDGKGGFTGSSIIKNGSNGSSYTSAYDSSKATWPTCGQGAQCSSCTQNSCKCSTGSPPKSCDGTCCNKCDIRICAGIFVALVPALETALRELKDKCNAEAKKNGNSSKKIHEDPIKGYFTALGYEESYLNDRLTGSVVNTKLSRATRQLEEVKKKVLGRDGYFKEIASSTTSASVSSSSSPTTTPKTVREMLLWLMGLPYCEGYKKFVEKLKEKSQQEPYKSIVPSTRTPSGTNSNPLAKQLSAVIFHLPTVFYSIEGDISYLKEVFDQFKKDSDAKTRFCYPTTETDMLNTLSAYVAVCYPILKYLMQRCDMDAKGRRRPRAAGTSPTQAAEGNDGSWGDLLVSGQENKDAQKQHKAASGATPSNVPPTALKDFLVFMGFKTGNGTVTGDDLYEKALAECFSPNVKDDEDDDDKGLVLSRSGNTRSSKKYDKLPALRKLAKHVLQEAYGSAAGGAPAPGGEQKVTPSTIRQMMLWLIGLPLTEAYKSSSGTTQAGTAASTSLFGDKGLVVTEINNNPALKELEKGQLNGRRITSTATATGKHFKQQLKDSIVGMIMLFQRIEGGLGSVVEFLKEGFKDKSGGGSSGAAQGNGKFKYDGKTILNVFSSYVYKVHTQLRFLKVMCTVGKGLGGWNHCIYGGSNQIKNDVTGIRCQCSGTKYTGECHHPLQHFLTDDDKEKSLENRFKHGSNLVIMGFSSERLPSQRTEGSHIHTYLEQLLDPIPTTAQSQSSTPSKPLSLLTQYCVAIGPLEPESLGDHFDVFRELAGDGMWSKIQTQVKESVKGITKDDESGQGASGRLQQALQAVWPTGHNGQHDGDLVSLTGCNDGNNCTPFIATLSHGLYQYFDPQPLLSPAQKINWLYMKMSALYGKLKKLLENMKKECKCCKNGNSKSCQGITRCPVCLPLLYKMGLVFGSAEQLSVKTCSELHTVMGAVLAATSKLCVVFESIDKNRFWPYLLFSAMVVHGKKEQLQVKPDGDENINCYTYKLKDMYEAYLKEKQENDTTTAQTNKQQREGHLACKCPDQSHSYSAPAAGSGTATVVTLTLYFQGAYINTAITLSVPFHGPLSNPLVRFYPRNLKSIVDWLLRIGQTRLEQEGKDAGVTEMITMFWPKIHTHLTVKDQGVFQQLVTGVVKLMGMENQGKKEVEKEVQEKLNDVKKKITDKLNGNGEGFNNTFTSILKFNPKKYIDKVIKDFGQKPSTLEGKNGDKRSYWCVAKAVSKCMNKALETIKQLATENKTTMQEYNVDIKEELNQTDIQAVDNLNGISNLKTLCDGFKKFKEVYDKVTGAFNNHLKTAQTGTGKTHWDKVNKCVEAFKVLGECVTDLEALNGMSSAEKMHTAAWKLEKLYDKLQEVHTKLNGDALNDISKLSKDVEDFVKELDEKELLKDAKQKMEQALQINNGKSQNFDDIIRAYITNVISGMKSNHKECDIHLRVRNDLQQLSECLKVMCEVCSTGMKEFAENLKECVWETREKMKDIDKTKDALTTLQKALQEFNKGDKSKYEGDMKEAFTFSFTVIRSLLRNPYIYQPQPIVSNFIEQQHVQKMTTYLKSLPDLIRDRYVLQKWKDSPETFCGVQSFDKGMVKQSDIEGISGVLQELLKDTFHNDKTFGVTIHTFQVRALIYNFCHKEGIKGIDVGIKVMRYLGFTVINAKQSEELKWETLKKKNELSPLLTKLSGNSYLKYFATHLRDSIGYHTLSNTLGALDKVKEKLGEKNPNGEPAEWKNIQELLQKTAIEDLSKRLEALLDKLNREYIFEYPPFDWTKSCKRLTKKQAEAAQAAQGSRAKRATDASPSTGSNTCDLCAPSMAHIFIGFVPQMYRLFKMLRDITKDGREHKLELTNNGRDAVNKCVSSLAGILSREGWRVKLGSDMTKDVEVFPFDLDASKKGKELCDKLDEIIGDKEPGALVAQRENNVSTTDSSLKPLDQLFKAVMQHFRTKRDEKIDTKHQALEAEFKKNPNNAGLTFQPPLPQLPSTVRQLLFWLHEMDTKGEFYKQLCDHIFTLCNQSSIQIYDGVITHLLKLSITQCLEVLSTIEDPGRQNADYYYELYTEEHYYAYPTVNIPLFFYTFVEKLIGAFLELNFVCVQCEFVGSQGGWSECHIGKSEHSMKGQNCRCTKPHTKASPLIPVTVSGSVVCPRPLSAFLFSDQKNQLRIPGDVSQRLPYMSKGTMPCGFKLTNKIEDAKLITAPTSVTGSVLVEPLRKLVGGHVTGRHKDTSTRNDENNTLRTVIYLRDLLRYTLCLAVRPPWSMSENMAFFYRVTESWKKNNNVVGVGSVRVAHPNGQLLGAIHAEIALFPGTFEASLLTSAVERFAGIEDTEHKTNDGHTVPPAPSGHHQYDLRSLMGCKDNSATSSGTTVQCSPFMFPLSLDVYTHYDHRNSRAYLSWILNFAFGIYGQLKALEERIKEQKCVVKNASTSTPQCPLLPMCPGVLSALYQSGSSFMDQGQLAKKENTTTGGANTTKKTCNDFHSVLTGLFNCSQNYCTPLHNLIVQCEAFLWSIRMPFSLVQLSLWSVAVLFISYVFVVPLDHFKIKSHLFNRLKYTMHPSLLIADQQRRVSEVAYFSL